MTNVGRRVINKLITAVVVVRRECEKSKGGHLGGMKGPLAEVCVLLAALLLTGQASSFSLGPSLLRRTAGNLGLPSSTCLPSASNLVKACLVRGGGVEGVAAGAGSLFAPLTKSKLALLLQSPLVNQVVNPNKLVHLDPAQVRGTSARSGVLDPRQDLECREVQRRLSGLGEPAGRLAARAPHPVALGHPATAAPHGHADAPAALPIPTQPLAAA